MPDLGERQELSPEEAAELDAMESGQVLRDPETGAIIEEDGSFDFEDADTSPPSEGYGLDDFLDDVDRGANVAGRVLDVAEEAQSIIESEEENTPPARRRPDSGTRTVSDTTPSDVPPAEAAAEAAPTVLGWPDIFQVDSDANVYVFGFKIPWWGVMLILGAIYIAWVIFAWLFLPKRRKKWLGIF